MRTGFIYIVILLMTGISCVQDDVSNMGTESRKPVKHREENEATAPGDNSDSEEAGTENRTKELVIAEESPMNKSKAAAEEDVAGSSSVKKEPDTLSKPVKTQTQFDGDYVVGETMSAHIKHLNENKYMFTLMTSSSDGSCEGEVQGLISLSEKNVAAYKEDLMGYCELTLEFPGDYTLVVTEGECDLHGEQCGFGGVYSFK